MTVVVPAVDVPTATPVSTPGVPVPTPRPVPPTALPRTGIDLLPLVLLAVLLMSVGAALVVAAMHRAKGNAS